MIKVVIFKDVLLLVLKTPLSFSNEECSYLAQLLLRSRSSVLKISCMASNAKASYAFGWRVFIFGILIAYGV